jgi:hypothetical protein
LDFAKKSWLKIVDAGLAIYKNDLERVQAALRFIALCDLYRDFHEITFDKFNEPDYELWAEELKISEFRLGQLLCSDKRFLDEDSDFTIKINAVHYLSNKFREEVFNELKKAYRNEKVLFFELYKTSYPDPEEYLNYGDNYEPETYEDVVNEIIPKKERAFLWLSDGCQPLYPDNYNCHDT